MSHYSENLEKQTHKMNDIDYSEESMRTVMSLFRSCWDALTIFLIEKGYQGAQDDYESMRHFMIYHMKKNKVERPRKMNEWFEKMEKISEDSAYRICFAFKLNVEEVKTFFRKVYLDRCFDCHQLKDAIYYYCFLHQYDYEHAKQLEAMCPKTDCGNLPDEIIYTDTIRKHIEFIENDQELIQFLNENIHHFGYNNATATTNIKKLWNKIASKGGLAEQEKQLLPELMIKEDSVWSIYLQILGLDNIRGSFINSKRSLKSILVNNDLILSIAQDSFPSRNILISILEGKHVSYRSVRKLLILLKFYQYWIEVALQKYQNGEYPSQCYYATEKESVRCRYQINRYLLECGYHELYIGNPYDWIFLWANQSDSPLDYLRSYFLLLSAHKSEVTND